VAYRTVLARALAVGVGAGLLLAVYLLLVVEPTIRDAIALEGHHDGAELFTRSQQVGGGMLATVLYAVVAAVIFATVYAAVRHRIPAASDLPRAAWLAVVGFVTVALVPALKYPANPPGVGSEDTVGARTIGYLVLLAASVLVAVLLVRLSGWLRHRTDHATRVVAVAVVAAAAYGLLLVVLPAAEGVDVGAVPAGLLWDFRVRSLGGLALLWATLGLGLGWSLERA
jgi:predicted cobalt transporter CbtA